MGRRRELWLLLAFAVSIVVLYLQRASPLVVAYALLLTSLLRFVLIELLQRVHRRFPRMRPIVASAVTHPRDSALAMRFAEIAAADPDPPERPRRPFLVMFVGSIVFWMCLMIEVVLAVAGREGFSYDVGRFSSDLSLALAITWVSSIRILLRRELVVDLEDHTVEGRTRNLDNNAQPLVGLVIAIFTTLVVCVFAVDWLTCAALLAGEYLVALRLRQIVRAPAQSAP